MPVLLEGLLVSLGQGHRLAEARLGRRWAEIVGGTVGRWSVPLSLKGETLTIGVYNSVWLNQLTFLGDEILRNLSARWEGEPIRSLRFTLVKRMPSLPPLPPGRPTGHLSPEEVARIEDLCGPIADDELKDMLRRFLLRQAELLVERSSTGATRSSAGR
jgi:hypothetical protein